MGHRAVDRGGRGSLCGAAPPEDPHRLTRLEDRRHRAGRGRAVAVGQPARLSESAGVARGGLAAGMIRRRGYAFPRISRTTAALSPTWSPNCWYMPTIIASDGLMFVIAVLMHCRTSAGEPTRRPAAKTLYARHGFLAALITLNIFGGSVGR